MDVSGDDNARIRFIQVLAGFLALFRVPDSGGLQILQESGCTSVVVFATKTSSIPLESHCRDLNIAHLLVISNGITKKVLESKKKPWFFIECLYRVRNLLQSGGHILVHHESRIALSGIFVYGLLRISGSDPDLAREQLKTLTPSKCGKISFEVAELLALYALNDSLLPLQLLSGMRERKIIESPLIFLRVSLTHKCLVRLDCIVTDQLLTVYALGPTLNTQFNLFKLLQGSDNTWAATLGMHTVIGGLPVTLEELEKKLLEFFQSCFGKNKAVWAGHMIQQDLVFLKRSCPNLMRIVGEEMIRTGEERRESICHEIIDYKRSLNL